MRSGVHGVGLESPRCTLFAWSLIHSQPSMTSTKRSGSRLISGSSDLTWEGASESNSWRRVEREGQRKMKWAKISGAVRHSLQVESPGSVPFILRRNLSLQAITANQHSNSEVGSAGAWLVDRAG